MKTTRLFHRSPSDYLAADEAFLDWVDAHPDEPGVAWFWESETPFVVLGYANHADREADLLNCKAHDIGVYRRLSGGGTVVQGPGCLNYALAMPIDPTGETATVTATNQFVMKRNADAISELLGEAVTVSGCTDLAIAHMKFSGNAQRRRRRSLLFHGTILYNFDLSVIPKLLRAPSQQPAYRDGRSHLEFTRNIPARSADIEAALRSAWNATHAFNDTVDAEITYLAANKYAKDAFRLQF
jgi:lipoate-protein ligase A